MIAPNSCSQSRSILMSLSSKAEGGECSTASDHFSECWWIEVNWGTPFIISAVQLWWRKLFQKPVFPIHKPVVPPTPWKTLSVCSITLHQYIEFYRWCSGLLFWYRKLKWKCLRVVKSQRKLIMKFPWTTTTTKILIKTKQIHFCFPFSLTVNDPGWTSKDGQVAPSGEGGQKVGPLFGVRSCRALAAHVHVCPHSPLAGLYLVRHRRRGTEKC